MAGFTELEDGATIKGTNEAFSVFATVVNVTPPDCPMFLRCSRLGPCGFGSDRPT
jgi:hypothetical protein